MSQDLPMAMGAVADFALPPSQFTGSGGKGSHRGGDGVIREIEFLEFVSFLPFPSSPLFLPRPRADLPPHMADPSNVPSSPNDASTPPTA